MRSMLTSAIVLAGLMGGCAGQMDLPKHFVAVRADDLGDYHVRGISADGVVVGLRSEDNPTGGTLEFWSDAVAGELTGGRGYKLMETESITARSGLEGRMMTLSTTRSGGEFTYVLGVYIKGPSVLIAEAGGMAGAVEKHLPELREAMLSVR